MRADTLEPDRGTGVGGRPDVLGQQVGERRARSTCYRARSGNTAGLHREWARATTQEHAARVRAQRRTALLLRPLADDMHVRAGTQPHVGCAKTGEFRQAQPGLNSQQDQCMVSAA